MENRVQESSTDRTDKLARHISEARTPQEFQDALDDMAVHLIAQRELAIKIEKLLIDEAICQHAT